MKKFLLFTVLTLLCFASYAQDGGIKGQVMSRNGRTAVGQVKVTIESTGQSVVTDDNGYFAFNQLPQGDYKLNFSAPDFEQLDVMVRVERNMRDLHSVIIVPTMQNEVMDDSVFAEFDNDSSASDTQALPSSLSASKDIYNNIAS